jgi:hypothetical protein
MNTHADKTTETKSNAVANGMAVQQGVKHEGTFQLEDNRPETITQRKIQQAANNSPQVNYSKTVQALANNSPQVKQLKAVQAMADNKKDPLIDKPSFNQPGVAQLVPVIADQQIKSRSLDLLDQHQAHLAQAIGELKRSNNPLEANSANWFEAGGDHTLYAIVPTDDSAQRATAAGKDGQRAFFGFPDSPVKPALKRTLYNAPYTNAVERDENVMYEKTSTQGFNNGATKSVAIINPADKSKEKIAATLIHEVQHSADRHNQEISRKGYAEGSWQKALERYKSEYRAYSIQPVGGPAHEWFILNNVNKLGYEWPNRQWIIFDHLYTNYPYVQVAWDAEEAIPLKANRNFQKAVVAYKAAETSNSTNNLILEQCYNKLEALYAANPLYEEHNTVAAASAALLKLDELTALEMMNSPVWNRIFGTINNFIKRALLVVINPIIRKAAPPALTDEEAIEVRKYFKNLELDSVMRFRGDVINEDSDLLAQKLAETPRGRHAATILKMPAWETIKTNTKQADEFAHNHKQFTKFTELITSSDELLDLAYASVQKKPKVEPDKKTKIDLCLEDSIWYTKLLDHKQKNQSKYSGYTTKAVGKLEARLKANSESYLALASYYRL